MRDEVAHHPLAQPFWQKTGTRSARNSSMTEDDWDYTVRLDESSIELKEERTSYFDGSVSRTRTLRGSWEPLAVSPQRLALRLSGLDEGGAPVERVLIITDDDILHGDLAWGLALLGAPGSP